MCYKDGKRTISAHISLFKFFFLYVSNLLVKLLRIFQKTFSILDGSYSIFLSRVTICIKKYIFINMLIIQILFDCYIIYMFVFWKESFYFIKHCE